MAVARSADRWLTISEAARSLGMSRTTLLAAEEAGLLRPLRTPGGHRRYSPAELGRYLRRAGMPPAQPPTGPGPSGTAPPDPPELAAAVRSAVRPIVQVLDAECGGLYRPHAGELRFTAAFGVPRWLTERLGTSPAPAPLVDAAGSGRHRLFDAARVGFPEPRASGHGLATPLRRDDELIGVLFLVRPPGRELLPGELRTVDAFGDLLATLVQDQQRIARLEHRLAQIAALSSG